MGWVRKLLQGDNTAFSRFPERTFLINSIILLPVLTTHLLIEYYVDVEDVARLCVIGLLDETVKSERIFAFAEQANWTDTVTMLRELRPNNEHIPDPPENELRDRTEVLPRGRAEALLHGFYGLSGFTSVKDSLEKGIEGWE